MRRRRWSWDLGRHRCKSSSAERLCRRRNATAQSWCLKSTGKHCRRRRAAFSVAAGKVAAAQRICAKVDDAIFWPTKAALTSAPNSGSATQPEHKSALATSAVFALSAKPRHWRFSPMWPSQRCWRFWPTWLNRRLLHCRLSKRGSLIHLFGLIQHTQSWFCRRNRAIGQHGTCDASRTIQRG